MAFIYVLAVTGIFCVLALIWTQIQLHKPEGQD